MGKLVEAVRSKNPNIDENQIAFVTAVDAALDAILQERSANDEKTYSAKMQEAVRAAIGDLPKEQDGSVKNVAGILMDMAGNISKIESQTNKGLRAAEKFMLAKTIKSNLENIRNLKAKEVYEVEFSAKRAAIEMTTATVLGGKDIDVANLEDEICLIKYPKNYILEILTNTQVSRVPGFITKRKQKSKDGAAAVVAEGALKPLVSYVFEDVQYKPFKVAAHMEMTDELEFNYEQLYLAIIALFERDVLIDWQKELLAKFILTATPYVATPLDDTITNPNVYDAVGALILQLQALEATPDTIWMNPADLWKINLTKDSEGQYVIPPFSVDGMNFAGLRLMTSIAINAGKLLIGDSSAWREQHSDYRLRIGYINDQLIKNKQTIVGEVESLLYPIDCNPSWIYADITTVQAALLKPSV